MITFPSTRTTTLEERMTYHKPLRSGFKRGRKSAPYLGFGVKKGHVFHKYTESFLDHSMLNKFEDYEDSNIDLDMDLKNIVVRASKAVVSIILLSGEKVVSAGSGFILESNSDEAIILTSAVVIAGRNSTDTILIRLSNGDAYKGRVLGHDPHYNLAALKIKPSACLPISVVRQVDDSLAVGLTDDLLQRSSPIEYFNLIPGDTLITIGRHWKSPYSVMSAGGVFSSGRCHRQCKELCRLDCRISKSGIGGPVVNSRGEVIGICFYAPMFTPFFPINLALKWWDHFKSKKVLKRPSPGMRVANLYTADNNILEKIFLKFPNLSRGVIVEEVREGSAAAVCGIQQHDVIIKCSEHAVLGFLQFHEMLLEKVEEEVVLSVIRPSEGSLLNLHVTIPKIRTFYSWPVPNPQKTIRWHIYPDTAK